MGYETELQFTEVILDKKHFREFRTYVEKNRDNDSQGFHYMLGYVYLGTNEHGYLDWNLSGSGKKYLRWLSGERPTPIDSIDIDAPEYIFVEFCPIEEESVGKWDESEAFIDWLSSYCISGQIIQISWEGDGAIVGWEFNRGRYRELRMAPVGNWRSRRPNIKLAQRRKAHKGGGKQKETP